jgi:hypothetical protein
MLEILQRDLTKAIRLLESMDFQFAIIDADGNVHGTLKVAELKQKRRKGLYEKGELSNYIAPRIKNLNEKEFTLLPYDKFERNIFQRAACSIANKMYGKGNFTTHMTPDGLQFIRLITRTNSETLI